MSALPGESAVNFAKAMERAMSGERVTRAGREAWIEFDKGAKCMTLNNGQTHRVRWVSCETDETATDWKVVEFPTTDNYAAKTMGAVLELLELWKQRAAALETSMKIMAIDVDRCRAEVDLLKAEAEVKGWSKA